MSRTWLGAASAIALGCTTLPVSLPAFAQTTTSTQSGKDDTTEKRWTFDESMTIIGTRMGDYATDSASVSRLPVPIFETPQSIQVLPRTLLDEQEINTLSDALINISGVVPNAPAETVLVNPIVRGLESEIYVDGLISYGDTAVIDPSSLVGIERVEVAKGPTSVLFGGGTGAPVGGLINVVTKTPEDEAFVEFGLRTGSFGTIAPNIDLNLPIGTSAGFRIAGEYFASNDFIDDVEIDRITLNPSFGVDLTQSTEFLLRVMYNRIEQLEYSGLPAEVAGLDGVDPFQFVGTPDQPRTIIENVSVHGAVTHQFSDTLSGQIQARFFRNEFDEFSSFPFLAFFPIEGTTVPIVRGQLPVDTTEATVDGSLTAEFETGPFRHVAIGGITYDATDYEAASGFDLVPLGIFDFTTENDLSFGDDLPALTTFLANDYRTFAAYFKDQISLGERVNLALGLRFSRYRLIEQLGGQGTDATFDEFDPRVGVNIKIAKGIALYGGYAQGSRLSLFFLGIDGAPPELETSENFEVGFKFGFENLGLSGTLAAFRNNRENVPTPDPTTFFVSVQTGEQRAQGFELDLVWEPVSQLSFLLSAAFTDAEVLEDTVIPAGDGLPRVPRYSGRFAGRYRFDQGILRGFGFGAGLNWQTGAETTLPNSFATDGFVLVDAQASYEIGRYRLGVTVQNINGADAFTPYQFLAQAVVRPVQPRLAFVTLSATF